MSDTNAVGERPRRRRDAAATRQALLTATRHLVGERGVEGTSTRDIAAAVGVNQTLVYRYFGSKDKLVAEAAAGEHAGVDVTTTSIGELPRELLDDAFDRSEHAAERDGAAFWALVGGANDEVIRDLVRERIDTMFSQQLAGRLQGPDPALRAELFSALLAGLVFLRTKIRTPALSTTDRDTLARYVDRVAAVLLGDGGDDGPTHGES